MIAHFLAAAVAMAAPLLVGVAMAVVTGWYVRRTPWSADDMAPPVVVRVPAQRDRRGQR